MFGPKVQLGKFETKVGFCLPNAVAVQGPTINVKKFENNIILPNTDLFFTPDEIAGMAAWWDASDTSTITHVSGAVSQWDDKSGLGNHVVQGVSANQPITGSSTVNGKNVLDFVGGSNATASWLQKTGMSNPNIQEFFFVITVDSTQANGGCCQGLLGNDADQENIRLESAGNHRFRYNNDTTIPGAPGDNNDFGAGDGQWNPDGITGSVLADLLLPDDVATRVHCTRGNNATQLFNSLRIGGDKVGGGRYMTMKLAELIAYDVTLSAASRTAVRDYLKSKWGVA